MQQHTIGTVLVTGGAGFIGRAIADKLAAHADRWIIVDNLNPRTHQGTPTDLAPAAELIVGDVADHALWERVLAELRPDVVIHLAAETDTGLSLTHATRFSTVNVTGTAVMLDAFAARNISPAHILVASSRAVYGEGNWQRASGETFSPGQRSHRQLFENQWEFPNARPLAARAAETNPHPTSIYGATKHSQETMLAAWCGGHDSGFTSLRLQNVYGSGQSLINPYTGILPLFVQLAARGEAIPVYEDGRMTRDFVHVDDVVAAFIAAVERGPASSAQIFDVGTGVGVQLIDIAARIAALSSAPTPIVTGAFRDGDVRHAFCDISATEQGLGWTPAITWSDGIDAYFHWFNRAQA